MRDARPRGPPVRAARGTSTDKRAQNGFRSHPFRLRPQSSKIVSRRTSYTCGRTRAHARSPEAPTSAIETWQVRWTRSTTLSKRGWGGCAACSSLSFVAQQVRCGGRPHLYTPFGPARPRPAGRRPITQAFARARSRPAGAPARTVSMTPHRLSCSSRSRWSLRSGGGHHPVSLGTASPAEGT